MTGVMAAIKSDRTFGGAIDDLTREPVMRDYGVIEFGKVPCDGFIYDVWVMAPAGASIKAIRDGLKANLEAAVGAGHAYDTIPDAAQLPAAVVEVVGSEVITMGGTRSIHLEVVVLVQKVMNGPAQDLMDELAA